MNQLDQPKRGKRLFSKSNIAATQQDRIPWIFLIDFRQSDKPSIDRIVGLSIVIKPVL